MAKFEITATKIINYSAVIEAENAEQAREMVVGVYTIDDFFQSGEEFTIDYIEEAK